MLSKLPISVIGVSILVALALNVLSGIYTAFSVPPIHLYSSLKSLNTIANITGYVGIAWGGPTMIMGFKHMVFGRQDAMKAFLLGAAGVIGGLATIAFFNWLVAAANEADLFC